MKGTRILIAVALCTSGCIFGGGGTGPGSEENASVTTPDTGGGEDAGPVDAGGTGDAGHLDTGETEDTGPMPDMNVAPEDVGPGGDGGMQDMGIDGGPDMPVDLCANAACEAGEACDPDTGMCVALCEATQTFCASENVCISTAMNPAHCGSCDNDCDALAPFAAHTRGCVSGACEFECDMGWSDIDGDLDSPNSNGCEAMCTPTNPPTEVCDGVDNDCDGSVDEGLTLYVYFEDTDGDGHGDANSRLESCEDAAPPGWVTTDGDCDPDNPSVNPDAEEICDSVDNDCDGQTDEMLPIYTWYRDLDQDGVGGGSPMLSSGCFDDAPAGYVASTGDCDDNDPSRYPGNLETCDNIDNDCNGLVDDGLPQTTYYEDNDNDGYGGTTTVTTCDTPQGYVTVGGDCDDTEPSINPGANDVCDGVDTDCDGSVENPITYYRDKDDDGYGVANDTIVGCGNSTPNGYATVDGDCDDAEGQRNPGLSEICDGLDNDCNAATQDSVNCVHEIFVTNVNYVGANIGGFTGADAICVNEAGGTPPFGQWRALISTETTGANDRIIQAGPVENVMGDVVWNAGDMFKGTLLVNPFGYSSDGTVNNNPAWTGTQNNGDPATGETCSGFSNGTGNGQTGNPQFTDDRWTENSSSSCTKAFRLYCINSL